MSVKKSSLVAIITLLVIVGLGFFIHLRLFSKTEYVNGTDGGFYAYKVRELVEEGKFDWNITSSPPLIFLTSAAFAKLFGVFNGVKMGTAFFSVLLGVSVYLLTHYLSKNKIAALSAAFFAIFNPMSLRIAADIRKNAAVLVFMPLIVYFYLRFAETLSSSESRQNWIRKAFSWRRLKYIVPLVLAGVFGLLSHSSIITIWFAFLAYFAFSFSLERKISLKEFIPVFSVNLLLIVFFAIFYDKFSDKLEAIAAPPAMLNSPQFENLNTYILPLVLLAVPGVISALTQKRRRDIFLIAWTLLLFLLTFSQTVGPSEYWRFVLIMFVPITVLAGCGIAWAWKKLGKAALIIPLAVAGITTQQFFAFGESHSQMFTQLHEEILASLETAADQIPHNSHVYTSCPHHNYYWVRYFFGVNTTRDPEQSIPKINELISEGNDVYIVRGLFESDTGGMGPLDEMEELNGEVQGAEAFATYGLFEDLETVYEDEYVILFKVTAPINVLGAEAQSQPEMATDLIKDLPPERQGYELSRLRYLSTYLILPYEAINALNPPLIALWQIELGLPLSVMLIGFAVSLLLTLRKRLSNYTSEVCSEIAAIVIGVLLVTFIYGMSPSIFWGAPQTMANGNGASPPVDSQEGEGIEKNGGDTGWPCGDGICDEAEQVDPDLCPQDCP